MRNWLVVCGLFAVVTAHAETSSAQAAEPAQPAQPAQPAVPGEVARAEGFAADAYAAYERQDFAQAVALYRRALAASPSPDIVYNLARIYDTKLKDRGHAIEFYERYTNDPGADPERARTAIERLASLRELETISANQRAEVAAASSSTASARARGAELTAPETPVQPARSGLSGLQVASIVVGTVGLAGVGLGIGFGLDAKSQADRSHHFCDGNQCFTPEGVDAAKHASRSATISTIAFIGGGALVAAGVTMLILGSTGESEQEARVQLAPYADRYGAGTQLIGRW